MYLFLSLVKVTQFDCSLYLSHFLSCFLSLFFNDQGSLSYHSFLGLRDMVHFLTGASVSMTWANSLSSDATMSSSLSLSSTLSLFVSQIHYSGVMSFVFLRCTTDSSGHSFLAISVQITALWSEMKGPWLTVPTLIELATSLRINSRVLPALWVGNVTC